MASNSNKNVVPEAKTALDKFKMEAASDEDVPKQQRVFRNLDK